MQPNILIHSPPGHGKTVLLGSGLGDERIMPMILLDLEAGVMSIESKITYVELDDLDSLAEGELSLDTIYTVRIRSWEDFQVIYEWLVDHAGRFKTIGLDSLSETNHLNLEAAVTYATTKNPKHNGTVPELQDYGRSLTMMRKLIRAFRDLPATTLFTTHCKEERDPRSQQMQTRPNLTGKLTNELPGMLDIMGYLALDAIVDDNGEEVISRVLVVAPTPTMMAKDRSEGGKLGKEIMNPTLPLIFDLLEAPTL